MLQLRKYYYKEENNGALLLPSMKKLFHYSVYKYGNSAFFYAFPSITSMVKS